MISVNFINVSKTLSQGKKIIREKRNLHIDFLHFCTARVHKPHRKEETCIKTEIVFSTRLICLPQKLYMEDVTLTF